MTQHFENLLDLRTAPVYRADLVFASQQIQVRRKMFQEGRQLETLAQALLPQFVVPNPGGDARHEDLRLDTMVANDRYGNALAFLENRLEQVGRFDRLPSGTARLMEGELEHELGCLSNPELAARERRQHLEVFFER